METEYPKIEQTTTRNEKWQSNEAVWHRLLPNPARPNPEFRVKLATD